MKHPDPEIEALLTSLAHPNIPVIDLSLDRIHALLALLGNPHRRLPPVIHVAGTNGKGSLLAYLKAIFEAAGYKVHRYISPHLVKFNERIMISGNDISDYYLQRVLSRIAEVSKISPVTAFEAITAAAYLAFSEMKADILLLETGMGGRLDATNVLDAPALTAITSISMDHMDYLGPELSGIAAEKAGIIKQAVPCVVGPQAEEALDIIEAQAQKLWAPVFRHNNEWRVFDKGTSFRYRSAMRDLTCPYPALPGAHQLLNAGTAIACIEMLPQFTISDEHIISGIKNATWPARLQHLKSGKLVALLPTGFELWLDGGHNAGAGQEIARWVQQQQKPVHLICGMLSTKDTEAFLKPMASLIASLTAIAIEQEPLSQSPATISGAASKLGIVNNLSNSIKSGIEQIVKSDNNAIILICGSLSLTGNTLWQNGTEP